VLVMDLDTSIRYVNPALEKLTGFSTSEIIGRKIPYPWWTEDTMKRLSAKAMGEEGAATFIDFAVEELYQKKNGERFWVNLNFNLVEDDGEPKYYLANWVDITERKRAEEELKKYRDRLEELVEERAAELKREMDERKQAEKALEQSGEYFRALIENAMDAIAIISADGTLVYESPSFRRLFGWTEEDHIGTDPFGFVHEEDMNRVAEVFANMMQKPDATVHEVLRFWHKDGSLRDVEVVGQNLLNNPIVNGIVANLHDITERKKAEDELEKYRQHLEELVEERTAELKKANEDLATEIIERERIQDALQQSEEKLRTIFESLGDALIVTDLTGTVIEVNEAALRVGGYSSKDELIGRNSVELISAEDVKRASEYMAKAFKEGQNVLIEHKMMTKDGREIDVEASGAMLRNVRGKPVGVVSVVKDITERKRMQEDLLLKESALEHSINAIAFSDMGGNITYLNQACLQLWGGGSKEELLGKPYWKLLEVESEELLKEIATSVFKNQVWEGEVVSRKKDGSEVILQVLTGIVNDSSGNPIQTVSAFINITERKRAEEALRDSEELSRGMLETAAMGIYLLKDGRFQYVNRLFEEITGYKSKELLGTYSLDHVHPDDRETVRAEAIRCLKGKRSLPFEYRFVRKNSEVIWVLDRVTSIQRKGERSVLGIFMDINERKRIEAEVAEYTRQIETLLDIGVTVSQTLNLTELLNSVLDRVMAVVGVEMGGIYLIDREAEELVLRAHRGAPAGILSKIERLKADRLTFSGKPVVVEDAGGDIKLKGIGREAKGLQSFAALPIMAKENLLGIMGVGSYEIRKFPEREIELLVNIANQIGMAVDNAQLYGQAVELASTDGLTGLYNRRYLMEQIEREFIRSKRSKVPLSLVMVDLDGLKAINDNYGHAQGDEFLRALGKIIINSTRASDIAARWGGDEFMLLTPETDSRAAMRIGERVRAQVEEYGVELKGNRIGMSISVGIASYPDHAAEVTELLGKVDSAMYNAKRGGKNQVCVFSS